MYHFHIKHMHCNIHIYCIYIYIYISLQSPEASTLRRSSLNSEVRWWSSHHQCVFFVFIHHTSISIITNQQCYIIKYQLYICVYTYAYTQYTYIYIKEERESEIERSCALLSSWFSDRSRSMRPACHVPCLVGLGRMYTHKQMLYQTISIIINCTCMILHDYIQ